jgi:hypothetical protein
VQVEAGHAADDSKVGWERNRNEDPDLPRRLRYSWKTDRVHPAEEAPVVSLAMLALVALFPVGLLGLLLLTSGLEGRVVRPGSDLVEAALSGVDDSDQE